MGNFVYHHCGILFYRPLYFPKETLFCLTVRAVSYYWREIFKYFATCQMYGGYDQDLVEEFSMDEAQHHQEQDPLSM